MNKSKIIVLSGAGISAESGIATFRDNNGLWENHRIEDVATPEAWMRNPQLVLDFYNARHESVKKAQPNQAHYLLQKLEDKYHVVIITQNVDDLHERAGSTNIIHLHGSLMQKCSDKNRSVIAEWDAPLLINTIAPDGGNWRPDIVWFGEDVPNMSIAGQLIQDADIVIIIGTSLQVYPAAHLVHDAPPQAIKYIIDPNINTKYIPNNYQHIKANATEGMQLLFETLINSK